MRRKTAKTTRTRKTRRRQERFATRRNRRTRRQTTRKTHDKKDAKKEEKKLKEQEKDVTEIAVDLELPRKTPKGTVVLRGATVMTMKGDEVLKNADIVVEDNRIKSVGAQGSVRRARK